MGFERVAIFGLIDLELESTGSGTITLSTDLPGDVMALRESKAIPACGRRVLRFRLQGTTKGRLYSVKVTPSGGAIRLYGGRIWARVLPGQPGQEWQWYTIPVPQTSDWEAKPLPIPGVGSWEQRQLPIPGVGNWEVMKLPVPPTSDWTAARLPIRETPANPSWINVPVDE